MQTTRVKITDGKKPWTQSHEERKKYLFNLVKKTYPKATFDTYIDEYRKELYTIIDKSDYAQSTKSNVYFMLSRYFYNTLGNENHYYKFYSNIGYELWKANEEEEGENQLDENEMRNWKPYEYSCEMQKNAAENKYLNLDCHYQYLLISLLYSMLHSLS
jgi:hypothetical protein